MNIDERIDRLTERHEALAQSVELLVGQGLETRKMVEATTASVKDVGETVKALSATVADLSATVSNLSATVANLSTTVANLSATVRETSMTVSATSKTVDVLSDGILDLLGIVRTHEVRIGGLESRAA